MEIAPRTAAKCFFTAWIFAWVVAIYVPSALLASLDRSPLNEGASGLGQIFDTADEVAPAAKIGFALIFAGLALIGRWLPTSKASSAVVLDMVFATIAMLVMLIVLPRGWSRGFGIGLTGERFAPAETIIYVTGALLSGLVFALSESKCRLANLQPKIG